MNNIRNLFGATHLPRQFPSASGLRGSSGLAGRSLSVATRSSDSYDALIAAYRGPRLADDPRSLEGRELNASCGRPTIEAGPHAAVEAVRRPEA